MDPPIELPAAVEPDLWNVVFHRRASNRFFAFIAFGKFKHVSAFAYVPGVRAWLVFDVQYRNIRTVILPDSVAGNAVLAALTVDSEIVQVRRRGGRHQILLRLLPWSCVPAICHLLGLPGGALRPDALYRYCLRIGGKVIDGPAESNDSNRPEPCPTAAIG